MPELTRGRDRVIEWVEARINLTEIFSLLTIFGLFYTDVDTSKPLRRAIREALSRPLPSYSRWPRVLGLIVLLLFLMEAITGFLLAFYYRPTPEAAYESIRIIARDVSFGWFVRQMHFWGAQLLVAVLMARLLRFFFRGLYRPPRELIWITAALLFLVATHMDFSGRLLSWHNESYWSSLRALDLYLSLPLVGSLFEFLIGGRDVNALVLTRFYFLHLVVLPLAFWLLLYFSFSGIRQVGLSEITDEEKRPARGVYLVHLSNLLILLLVLFGILVTLSVLLPRPFGAPVDPHQTPSGITLPWYLLAPYGLVEVFPAWVPQVLPSVLLLLFLVAFVFLPALTLRPATSVTRKPLLAGVVVLIAWGLFTYYGAILDLGSR